MAKAVVYDIIILGAGPAGLACALHCAEKGLKVLVLEQHSIGTTMKTWLSFGHVLDRFDLRDTVIQNYSSVVFSSYLGGRYACKKDFLFPINEELALTLIAERAVKAGATLRGKESFINYNHDGNLVVINSEKNSYHARLVIDAMGRESQILPSHGFRNNVLDMGCLSFFLKNARGVDVDTCLIYDSYFPGSDYFWVVPLGPKEVMVGIFFFSSLTPGNRNEKEALLQRYITRKGITGTVFKKRLGNIPLGSQTYMSAPGFISFGDSANTPLPSSGFSFSRCLEESLTVSKFVHNYLNGNAQLKDYKTRILENKIPGIEIHLIISDMLSKFTDNMLNKAINGMGLFGDDFIIDFLSGRKLDVDFCIKALTAISKTFTLAEISSMSLSQEYMKRLLSIYNLLPAMPTGQIIKQIFKAVKTQFSGKDNALYSILGLK